MIEVWRAILGPYLNINWLEEVKLKGILLLLDAFARTYVSGSADLTQGDMYEVHALASGRRKRKFFRLERVFERVRLDVWQVYGDDHVALRDDT